ncbi:hypothetical protein CWR48_01660 [Oceanobacillus arenosus]|uniref:DUF2269 domain-containing protein n=1 Tax=Oceanobacillus arenosus TaxID=1229153 RepID=A0A3D8Q3T4_9BACI|nr:hypothetical protein [Oceanobacillus arenosus]RDW22439.1 hypothetical protein CWR48_01660 [Oceanobacillus arenosus]
MKLSIRAKRWLLITHILFAAIMFGNMVTFLILSITITASNDPQLIESCYQVMLLLSGSSIRASTIGTTVTGILLCVLTKWGLFKFYWIIVKEVLTILLIGINIWGMYSWTLRALDIFTVTGLQINHGELLIGISIQLISLIIIFTISVFKPWGILAKKQKNKLS